MEQRANIKFCVNWTKRSQKH